MLTRFIVLLSFVFSTAILAANASISLEDYAKHAQFLDAKISPSGKYLAVSNRADDGNIQILVLDRENMKVMSQTHFRGQDTIDSFVWVSDERMVLTIAREIGSLERPQPTGELYAVNADGKKAIILTGFRSKDRQPTYSQIIDTLADDDRHIIIASRNLRNREPFIDFYRLNVENGRMWRVDQAPIRAVRGSDIQTITDADGMPRLIVGLDPTNDTDTLLLVKDDNAKKWLEIARFSEDSDRNFIPLALAADKKSVFGLSNISTETRAIAQFDLNTKSYDILAQHPLTDVLPIIVFDKGIGTDVIGASYEYDEINTVFFDNAAAFPLGNAIRSLAAAFPGKQVMLTSATRDNQLAVVRVESVNQDPTYYLFDVKNKNLGYLMNARPWLQNKALPETSSITYKARDGQTIQALLTLPRQHQGANTPLVLMPHGGPIGVRDSTAGFTPASIMAKVLAENGYAVLQPNFRGSGGFGVAFQQAGYQSWGGVMIDDMTDGVLHLAKEGLVDQNRVCTVGASYGGYAAVQTAIREPELYKCAIAYVGVFDLNALFTTGDVPETEMGLRFLRRTVGTEPAQLNAQSPILNLDKLKAPIFIAHGAEDRRTPLVFATAFRAELEKRGHSFEWLVKEKEGHGFYKPENNIEFWQRSLAFLQRHIGAPAVAQ